MSAEVAIAKNYIYSFQFHGANAARLNDISLCNSLIQDFIIAARMNEINRIEHQFSPQGVSIVALLAESHIALHTWPESGSGYVTLTTCRRPGSLFEQRAQELLTDMFDCMHIEVGKL